MPPLDEATGPTLQKTTTPPVLSFQRAETGAELDQRRVVLPLEGLVSSRLLLQAESGGGKSWLLRQILEQTNELAPQILFDLEGEFSSLRQRYPYVLVSATPGEGDLKADPETADALCRRLAQLGASAILDLYDLDKKDQQRFAAGFLKALLALPKDLWTDRLVLIDEADLLAPEKTAALSKAAVRSLVKRARKRRIGVVVATARLADLDKGAAGGLQNKLIGLTTLGNDMTRSASDLGFDRTRRASLMDLEPGTFFAQGPAFPFRGVHLVRSGHVLTPHGLDQPSELPGPPPSLARILSELADLDSKPTGIAPPGTSAENFEHHVRQTVEERLVREIPPLLEKRLKEHTADLTRRVQELENTLADARKDAATLLKALDTAPPPTRQPTNEPASRPDKPTLVREDATTLDETSALLTEAGREVLRQLELLANGGVKTIDRRNLAHFAGRSPRSSSYEDTLARLKQEALISYPAPGEIAITTTGGQALGTSRANPSTTRRSGSAPGLASLHQGWVDYLGGLRASLLEALLEVYPRALSRGELARASSVSPRSSSYEDALASLRKFGLVHYPKHGDVKVSELLFTEGFS